MNLGVIGMSEGNGHPYSWSAIFNGYNHEFMKDCPFPAIPEYLCRQNFPQDGLGHLARVTHIWTQEKEVSEHIAAAANIPNVTGSLSQMAGQVDAVLLARDDAERHYEMALPFLKAGIPVFIDKPLALSIADANKIFGKRKHDRQIYTCSALRFAKELQLSKEEKRRLGPIRMVEGTIMKKWSTYGIHLVEPVVAQLPDRGRLLEVKSVKSGVHQVLVKWENVSAYFKITGNFPVAPSIKFCGEKEGITKTFIDSFACFKTSLQNFVEFILDEDKKIKQEEVLEMIKIIELGNET